MRSGTHRNNDEQGVFNLKNRFIRMASKKQEKPKKASSLKFNWRDERIPKITGVI